MIAANVSSDLNPFIPALGKFWQFICSTRLLMTRPNNGELASKMINRNETTKTNDNSLRTIRIIKCNQLKTGNQCAVNISDSGVR